MYYSDSEVPPTLNNPIGDTKRSQIHQKLILPIKAIDITFTGLTYQLFLSFNSKIDNCWKINFKDL